VCRCWRASCTKKVVAVRPEGGTQEGRSLGERGLWGNALGRVKEEIPGSLIPELLEREFFWYS